LLGFVECKFGELSMNLKAFVERIILELGYSEVVSGNIVQAIHHSWGRVVQAIVDIDPPFFQFPKPGSLFDWVLRRISGRTTVIDYSLVVSVLSRALFGNRELNGLDDPRQSVLVPSDFAYRLLDALECELVVSNELLLCLLRMNFEQKILQRLLKIIDEKLPNCQAAVFSSSFDPSRIDFPARPPSYFRALMRLLLRSNKAMKVRHNPVHRALCYKDSFRIEQFKSNVQVADELAFGRIDLETVMTAQSEMFAPAAFHQIALLRAKDDV
jgi:hypothetical protein